MPENLTDKGWVILSVPVPPELVAIDVAPDLQRFFDAMIYKLRRNAHKGRWEDVPLEVAMKATFGEAEELQSAIVAGSTAEITMEAADVANQALIVAAIALEAKDATTLRTARPALQELQGDGGTKDAATRSYARDPAAWRGPF